MKPASSSILPQLPTATGTTTSDTSDDTSSSTTGTSTATRYIHSPVYANQGDVIRYSFTYGVFTCTCYPLSYHAHYPSYSWYIIFIGLADGGIIK
jgi:hypothetical protein